MPQTTASTTSKTRTSQPPKPRLLQDEFTNALKVIFRWRDKTTELVALEEQINRLTDSGEFLSQICKLLQDWFHAIRGVNDSGTRRIPVLFGDFWQRNREAIIGFYIQGRCIQVQLQNGAPPPENCLFIIAPRDDIRKALDQNGHPNGLSEEDRGIFTRQLRKAHATVLDVSFKHGRV